MKKTFLTAVSALAIIAATPAIADSKNMQHDKMQQTNEQRDLPKDIKKNWNAAKENVSDAAEDASSAIKETYHDATEALNGKDNAKMKPMTIDKRSTAQGILGQPVYNTKGERIAKVRDIIVGNNGEAMMVVLGDGDFTGLGKMVAFDYSVITKRNKDGDMLTTLVDEATIDKAAGFSYQSAQKSAKVKVMPANGLSVAQIMDGKLVDPKGETLAHVDNIVLRDGVASQIVVSYGGALGLGEKRSALSYNDVHPKPNGKGIDIELSAQKSHQFKKLTEAKN